MKKFPSYILILILIQLLTPTGYINAAGWFDIVPTASDLLGGIVTALGAPLLSLFSFITWLSGQLLNFTINYTIIDLRYNISALTGINIAWKVIRDLMNIAFIFMLIYEGIMLIIGKGNTQQIKKFIIGVVLASILINFSLFFTKVMIDASNIITVGFYTSILGNNANRIDFTIPIINQNFEYGLSDPIADSLNITSIYSANAADIFASGEGISGAMIRVGGAGILLITTAFIFFAVSMMFIIRYVALIILLMLSPIAYMGMALPFMSTYSKQWWSAFKSQLLFAPIYMLLTWVTLILMQSANFIGAGRFTDVLNGTTKPAFSSMGLLLNFAIIVGLLIASLIIAKTAASQGSKLIGQATGKLSGWAGSAVFGGSAWAGRKFVGGYGSKVADNADLQRAAKDGTGIRGAWARTKLYTARTARDASFDARNAQVPTAALGDAIEGTLGRTKTGQKMGLNDLNWSNVGSTASLSTLGGFGKAGTKGYDAEMKEKEERMRKENTANLAELAQAEAKRDIMAGKDAVKGTLEGDAAIEKMEGALSKMSDKQVETLVENNRELLASQNFANAISVKQLEALNKTDKLSDSEKDTLKDSRFVEINSAMKALSTPIAQRTQDEIAAIAALPDEVRNNLTDSEMEMLDPAYFKESAFVNAMRSTQVESVMKSNKFTTSQKNDLKTQRFATVNSISDPANRIALTTEAGQRTPDQEVVAKAISNGIKNLSDGELDMLDPALLADPDFVAQMRAPQIDTINKSTKLTAAQKDAFKKATRQPLVDAINNNNYTTAQNIIKKTSAKTLATYVSTDHIDSAGNPTGIKIALHPAILAAYTPQKLKNMASEMTDGDISKLRSALVGDPNGNPPVLPTANPNTLRWLNDADKGGSEFA